MINEINIKKNKSVFLPFISESVIDLIFFFFFFFQLLKKILKN